MWHFPSYNGFDFTVSYNIFINKFVHAISMEATLMCLLLNKLHLFILTQHRLILIRVVPLHVCYMFRPVLGSFSYMAIQIFTKILQRTL